MISRLAAAPTIPESPQAAPVDLNGRGHYLHWGFVQVSAANLIIVLVILAAFAAAIFLPFPKPKRRDAR